jgi:Na+-driven multidrug efflux pump
LFSLFLTQVLSHPLFPLNPFKQNDRPRARAALIRLLQLGGGLGVAVAACVIAGAGWLPSAFTSDPGVAAAAAAVLPVVALLMPLAPCGSAMEGALFGAMRVAWVGGRTVGACVVSLAILAANARLGGGLVGVWVASALLLFANAAADAWLLSSPKWSPVLAEDGAVAGGDGGGEEEKKVE